MNNKGIEFPYTSNFLNPMQFFILILFATLLREKIDFFVAILEFLELESVFSKTSVQW